MVVPEATDKKGEEIKALAIQLIHAITNLKSFKGIDLRDEIMFFLDEQMYEHGFFDTNIQSGWRVAIQPENRVVEIGGRVLVKVMPATVIPKSGEK